MAWETVIKRRGSASGAVTVAIFRSGKSLKLSISIAAATAAAIGWKAGTLVTVMRGTHEHDGIIRMATATGTEGFSIYKKTGGRLGLIMSPWPGLPTHPCRAVDVQFEGGDNANGRLSITLPKWAASGAGFEDEPDAARRGKS